MRFQAYAVAVRHRRGRDSWSQYIIYVPRTFLLKDDLNGGGGKGDTAAATKEGGEQNIKVQFVV